ncbi:MAG: hypothetical protein GF330_09165, partial [Candidatus Eisenbacteria bacterium]|nr:hypothetical protein [Candidatus Eisenbacteria bacterium]
MTGESLDPIRQKMVAALYGELPADAERELQAALAEDAELRAEWEELQAARGFLREAEHPEPAPSFVFTTPEPQRARRDARRG